MGMKAALEGRWRARSAGGKGWISPRARAPHARGIIPKGRLLGARRRPTSIPVPGGSAPAGSAPLFRGGQQAIQGRPIVRKQRDGPLTSKAPVGSEARRDLEPTLGTRCRALRDLASAWLTPQRALASYRNESLRFAAALAIEHGEAHGPGAPQGRFEGWFHRDRRPLRSSEIA